MSDPQPPSGAPAQPPPYPAPPYGAAGYPPQYATPPYGAPARPAAPYIAPVYPGYGAAFGQPVAANRGSRVGVVALILALLAAIAAPIVGAIAAFPIGIQYGKAIGTDPSVNANDLSFLSPVRDLVLVTELSFWVGTALGIWAIVQGIVAIVKRRGRGAGIGAIAVAIAGSTIFGIAVFAAITLGAGAGSSIGG